ncbi:MAG: hypothetical protein GF331_11265 [Chitinivibrionales bacterium]|nr:hypothetical protein [Chitinivibrionales bacterium]
MSNRHFIAPIMPPLAPLTGCGMYTLGGSTVPSYMNTVDVLLSAEQTL